MKPPENVEQASQQRPFLLLEQLIAPVEGLSQGAMLRQGALPDHSREPTAPGQPVRDLVRGQAVNTRGGQNERERQAVELAADARHGPRGRRRERERRVAPGGLIDEQAPGVRAHDRADVTAAGHAQRSQPKYPLMRDSQGLPARHQYPHVWCRPHKLGRQPSDGCQEVLAVVEHQQQAAPGEALEQHLGRSAAEALAGAEGVQQRIHDLRRTREVGQLDDHAFEPAGRGRAICR